MRAYSLTDHIHEREAGHHLSRLLADQGTTTNPGVKIAFIPAVTSWFSGILSTLSIPLDRKLTAADVVAAYEEMYKGERLVRIQREVPCLRDVEGKQGWVVGGFQVHSEGDRAVVIVRFFCSLD